MNGHVLMRRLSLALLIGGVAAAAPQLAMAASDSGTLTVGQDSVSCGGPGVQVLNGYYAALSFGSYSPTGLTGGDTVASIADNTPVLCTGASAFSGISVSGFSSNPGSGWLTSVDCNGVTNDESAAFQFSYSSGTAWWYWRQQFGLHAKNGSNVSCTIVHS